MDEHPTGDTSFKKGCEIEEGLDGSESMLRVLDVDPENCQEVRKVETVLTKIFLLTSFHCAKPFVSIGKTLECSSSA